MKLTKAHFIMASAAIVTIGGVAWLKRPRAIAVDVGAVAQHPLEATIDADGQTRVRERYTVVAPVAGRVARVTLTEGALVRAGDVLARISPLPLDSQSVMQAHAQLEAAQAMALEAATQVRVALASQDQRRRELSRAQRLSDVGGVSPRVVEESQLALTQANESAEAAQQRLRATEADVRRVRTIIVGRAGGATVLVRAPASGRVLRIAERSERIVASGAPLLEIGDPGSLEIVVDVLSSEGASIHPGDAVRLSDWSDNGGGEHSTSIGHVRTIEPSGFTKVSALGVEEQRVNVIIDPDVTTHGAGDGFRVEASIIVWSSPRALAIPRSALMPGERGANWVAFLVRGGRVEKREVKVGHVAGASAEVLAGVADGDQVVLFPSDQVMPGLRVRKAAD